MEVLLFEKSVRHPKMFGRGSSDDGTEALYRLATRADNSRGRIRTCISGSAGGVTWSSPPAKLVISKIRRGSSEES